MSVDTEIASREHAISMYGFDVWGTDAASNVDKMKELRLEIANLKEYGVARPSRVRRVMHLVSKRTPDPAKTSPDKAL